MFEIESIILFTGILSFLLIAGLHLMREEKGNETNDSNI